uniref:Serine/threonine-protein kinase rio2 n=1 Tax=Rhizophora mucronata TaxID=61149 RepID=A0A2P2LQY1_RHIMU
MPQVITLRFDSPERCSSKPVQLHCQYCPILCSNLKDIRLFSNSNLTSNSCKYSTIDHGFDCKKIIAKVGEPKAVIFG